MSVYEKASLVQIPSGYKASDAKLYSVLPSDGTGDFTVSVATGATRVNKDGLIESVSSNQAKLNYDPSNPKDPHLLLEPSRSNIYTYSEDLGQGTTLTNTTVDETSIVSPDGSLTGNKLTQTSGAFTRKNLGVVLSGTYAWSFFAKKGDLRYLCARTLFVQNGTTPSYSNNIIDLDTKTIAYKGTSVTSASVIEYPNDWIKVEIIATDNATSSVDLLDFFFTDNASSTATGVAGNGYLWGVQFESGNYGTSYIPNLTTGQTSRSADICEGAGNSTTFNDSEGVLFVEFSMLNDSDTSNRYISLSDGSPDNSIMFQITSGGNLNLFNNGTLPDNRIDTYLGDLTENIKVAVQYGETTNDYKVYINGASQSLNSSFTAQTISGLDTLSIDYPIYDFNFNGKVKQLMVFNEALTDAELESLTS